MYRTAGITGDAAGAGIVLSWFFNTGYKLVVPIVALVWILIEEGIEVSFPNRNLFMRVGALEMKSLKPVDEDVRTVAPKGRQQAARGRKSPLIVPREESQNEPLPDATEGPP